MHNNIVYPSEPPPAYSELPPAADTNPSYGQSTLLHADGEVSAQQDGAQQAPHSQSAWGDPTVNQYPPAGHAKYPQHAGPAPYPPPAYGHGTPSAPASHDQQQQQQQQVVVVNGGQQAVPVVYQAHESFVGQMILACVVLWCCNCLFGLIAFILAVMAMNTVISDAHSARQLGVASWVVSIVGIVISILVVVIVVAVVVTAAAAAAKASASSSSSSTKPPLMICANFYVDGSCYDHRKYIGGSQYYICFGRVRDGYCYYN